MIASLPTRVDIARYVLRVALSGVVFRLFFYFNRRDQAWYFDVTDPAGVPLRSGMKVVSKTPLLRQWIQQGRPDGELIPIDASSDVDPGIEELGERVLLVYDDVNF